MLIALIGCADPPAPVQAAPSTPFDPLAGKTPGEICESTALLLIRYPYEALEADYAGLCCTPEARGPHDECELDWPFSDVPPCTAYDDMRNGLFAAYGFPFKSPKWKKRFDGFPGYTRREDFDPGWLNATALANVKKLKKLKAERVSCTPTKP